MLSIKYLSSITICIVLFAACKKDTDRRDSCAEWEKALVELNKVEIERQVQPMLAQVGLIPVAAGNAGVTAKLQRLVELLNANCDTNAELLCAMCIDTNPQQSEMIFVFTSDRKQIQRIMDVFTEEGKLIQFITVHE